MPVDFSKLKTMAGQRSLFCPWGSFSLFCSGVCRTCYGNWPIPDDACAGHRDAVLARDGARCVACGSCSPRPHVYHRRPGEHPPRWLATVCDACHARIHKLSALTRGWLPPRLVELWHEQHPSVPLQLQFAWDAA